MAISGELDRMSELEPRFGNAFEADAAEASRFFAAGQGLIDRLPPRPRRSSAEQSIADALHTRLRATRVAFLRRHASRLYSNLTDDLTQFVRIEDLVYRAASAVPGLVPTRERVLTDRQHMQKDKEGYEVDQGLFLSQVLSNPTCGA